MNAEIRLRSWINFSVGMIVIAAGATVGWLFLKSLFAM